MNKEFNILRRLIDDLVENNISVLDFCDKFERIYNIDIDKSKISSNELKIYASIFEKVIWYSPLKNEREVISNYKDENEIISAVADAATKLSELR
jgi:hypothetical protein